MSEFEEHLHELQARGDVPDALLLRLMQARVEELEAVMRRRDVDTAIDAHVRTAKDVETMRFKQDVEHDLEHLEHLDQLLD